MSTAAEQLANGFRESREAVAGIHPENLDFADTLLLRSTLLDSLRTSEQLATIIHEEIYMTTKTLSAGADIESAYDSALVGGGDIDEMLNQSKREGEAAYRQIVLDIAGGRRVDPAALRNALVDSGRTADDLKQHVSVVNERIKAIVDRERAESLAATLPELKTKCDAANAALKEKEVEYRKSIEPMQVASRTAAEDYANCDVTVKTLQRDATNTLNRTSGHDYAAEFKKLSHHACRFEKLIREAESVAHRSKAELPVVEANIASLEGQVLREEAGNCNEPLIAQLNDQIKSERVRYDRLANSDKAVAELKAGKKAAEDALAEFVRASANDPKNIRWSDDRPVW
jgi:hypothetical protein